jgi:hypothetical protein
VDALYVEFLKLSPLEQIMYGCAFVTFIGTVMGWGYGIMARKEHEYAMPPDDGRLYRSAKTIASETRTVVNSNPKSVAPMERPLPPIVDDKTRAAIGKRQTECQGINPKDVNMGLIWSAYEREFHNRCKCGATLLPGKVDMHSDESSMSIICSVKCLACNKKSELALNRWEVLKRG